MSDEQEEQAINACTQVITLTWQRMLATMADRELLDEHFDYMGEGEFFGQAMQFFYEKIHDRIHAQYGNCDEHQKEITQFLTMSAFMLGRCVEEHEVIRLFNNRETVFTGIEE